MSSAHLAEIDRLLRRRTPSLTPHEPRSRAAVAMVLAPTEDELRLLLIKRADHPHDPWSGHMALPGGRHDPEDADLTHTAIRETAEEVGIDLARDGELVARLDDLPAVAQGRNLDMVISPFLFRVERLLGTQIDRTEVADALWIPMRVFRSPEHRGTVTFERDGYAPEYPAFVYEGHKVWGLTYRIIQGFLESLSPLAFADAAA